MPAVTCEGCGHGTDVSFKRGTRLADVACPNCRQRRLRMRTAGRPSRNTGKTYEKCARCGRRGLRHQRPAFDWTPRYAAPDVVLPAGSPCCWVEEPVPAARTAHQTVHDGLTERLGARRPGGFCWATPQERAHLEARAAAAPTLCTVCDAAGLPQLEFHTQAYGFAAGAALLAICNGCGHTVLLADTT